MREAAAELGLPVRSLYRLARNGQLPLKLVRVGRRILVVRSSLEHLLQGGQ